MTSDVAPPPNSRSPAFIRRLDDLCRRMEAAAGIHGAGMLVGVLWLAVAAVYVTPALTTVNHGTSYEQLSLDPWNFTRPNDMRLRILTPLLAHYTGFRGEAYLFFPLLVGVLFLATVYVHARRRGLGGAEAAGMAALMAFSTPILFVLHFQGYTDTTSYLLILLVLITIEIQWLWPPLYALALVNHESNLFVAPLLLVAANLESFRPGRTILVALLICLAVIPAALYRNFVELHGSAALGHDFYLNWTRLVSSVRTAGKLLPMGVFYAFKLFWLFPLVALAYHWRHRNVAGVVFVVVGFLCALAQVLIATDTSRLLGLAFPIILFGALTARENWGSERFNRRLWRLIGFNFLILSYYIGQATPIPFFPLPVSLALRSFLGVDPWKLWWSGY